MAYDKPPQKFDALTPEYLARLRVTLQYPLYGEGAGEVFRAAPLLVAEVDRLRALLSTPRIDDFLEAVRVEAAHQAERWGTAHDEGKGPTDWFWLLGFLAGKAVWSATHGDREKALHHTISSAAALMNWHAQLSGQDTGMRPGIATPQGETL